MTNEIFQFKGADGAPCKIRVAGTPDAPLFVAVDVCAALEIGNSRKALSRLDDDEKGVTSSDTLGGRQEMAVVNEFGLFTLILSSRKKSAKEFKRWVTHVVLPSIRKTGSYSLQSQESDAKRFAEKILLLEVPRVWRKNFPDPFFEAVMALYGWDQWKRSENGGTPGFCAGFIRKYIYSAIYPKLDVYLRQNRKDYCESRQIEETSVKLHQFIREQVGEDSLKAQIDKVTILMSGAMSRLAFEESFAKVMHGQTQTMLFDATPKRSKPKVKALESAEQDVFTIHGTEEPSKIVIPNSSRNSRN